MQVILLENISNLGELGDKVDVKAGFGRNYLIPHHKAVSATAENVLAFEARRAELQGIADEKHAVAQKRAIEVEALSITIATKAGEEGKLFGSITVRDIVEAVAAKSVAIDKGEVKMPAGPIRELGEFEINIQLHPEVTAVLKVGVITEE